MVYASALGRGAAALVSGGLVFAGAVAPAAATPGFDPTTVTIHAAPASVTAGQSVSVAGTLTDQVSNTGAASQSIVLYTRPTGTTKWAPLATVTTNASGAYTKTVTPTANTDFAAVFYGSSNLGVSTGGPVSITVSQLPKATVTIAVDHQSVPKFSVFHISTTVTPNAAGQTAELQMLFGTTWQTGDSTTISAGSTAVFDETTGAKGSYSVRVFVAAPDAGHGDGISPTLTLTVT